MNKLHYSITINASKEKVWNTMLNDNTYREWTTEFAPGSHFVGDWNTGSKILFLAPGKDGGMEGMVSRIRESRPNEYVSIEHLGMVKDGQEDTTSEAVKSWAGAHENYTLREKDRGTEVLIDVDVAEEYKDMFEDVWPRALQKLKDMCEK